MVNTNNKHDYNKKYEHLSIVWDGEDNNRIYYIAKRDVPRNIKITNTKYWQAVDIAGSDPNYSNIRNKPTINGVEVDGEMTSEDLGIYSKPNNGIPEFDLAPEVQTQLNKHFKGWYDSSSNLPANPFVGDYAYVKGVTQSDPVIIYECTTAGTWSDSGRTVDTSNVQTFASGEEVNDVHIIDDLTTGGSDNVLSAEQGKELGEYLGDGNRYTNIKGVVRNGIVSTNGTVTVSSSSSYRITNYIEVSEGQIIKFTTAVSSNTVFFICGYDENKQFVNNGVTNIAGGSTMTILKTARIPIPAGIKYIIICGNKNYVGNKAEYMKVELVETVEHTFLKDNFQNKEILDGLSDVSGKLAYNNELVFGEDLIVDLPVSADGSGIENGYAYIESTTDYIKVKRN